MSESSARVPFLSPEQRRRVLVEWNQTRREYPPGTIPGLVSRKSAECPEAEALVWDARRVSRQEIEAASNRLARYLSGIGVERGSLVAVCLDRSVEMVVGLLAVMKAGGAYVPLDPGYPRERVEFLLEDAGTRVALTQRRHRNLLEGGDRRLVFVDAEEAEINREAADPAPRAVLPGDLAYVIYTSGSTGKPKGVAIEHRSAVNLLWWAREVYEAEELAGVFASTSICFDLSVFELFVPLSFGGKVILGESALHLPGLQSRGEVTLVNTVPSAMAELVRVQGVPSSVKTVNLAGEALSPSLVREVYGLGVGRVFDLYGPSESTTYSTYALRRGDAPATVGRPVSNTRIYILDEGMEPVPVGVAGEIYIGGEGLARGYWRRPELTAERFVADPFVAGGRLYRTGDLGRYLPEGDIQFLGRQDHQVKVRGYRIELGEVEAALQQHDAVRECVVTAREDEGFGKRLVAYFAPEPEKRVSVGSLRDLLRRSLPEYMVPSHFVALSALPRTPNGKIDRRALPQPGRERPDLEQPYVEPRTAVERWLAEIWKEVLGLDRVGTHDPFFELGGDSIQGAVFINRVREKLGEFLYIVALFEAPTIALFAAFLRKNYPKAMETLFGAEGSFAREPSPASRTVDGRMLEEFRRLVPVLAPRPAADAVTRKNPAAIFILAPPRSGTTLLRVMLAGHPRLFAAAELQLLSFNTLRERRAAFTGKYALWLEGTYRALMEIRGCDGDEAKRIMAEYEGLDLTTKAFYRLLQDWIGEKVLVDKSPSYVLDLETLRRAEANFDSPRYIHLVRHPVATVRSFESYHLDQVFFPRPHPFSPRELAELVWLLGHQNAVRFFDDLPSGRRHRMRFEDLVTRPKDAVEEMCAALGVEFHPELLHPYRDKEKKMTDGIYPASMPMGDTHFQSYRDIDPSVLGKWRDRDAFGSLGAETLTLAESLGYEAEAGAERSGAVARGRVALLAEQRQRRRAHRSGEAPDA